MGAKAYKLIDKMPINGTIVEIGGDRGEGSTQYLFDIAGKKKTSFYTVDMSARCCRKLKQITDNVWNFLGEDFLQHEYPKITSRPIGFAYLDNFDLVTNNRIDLRDRRRAYRKYGLIMDDSNLNSKISHLKQALLVDKYSVPGTYIMVDDTWLTQDGWEGKGGLVASILPELYNYHIVGNKNIMSDREGLRKGYLLLVKNAN